MAMAITMREYLARNDVDYDEVSHPRQITASRVAESSHISGEKLAKPILIKGDSGYRVLLIPSTCRADLSEISHRFHERLGLATEDEIQELFTDCDAGALPGLAQAYGVRVYCDDSLMSQEDVYLESGDHETLVRMSNREFQRLMGQADHGPIARHL
jgi:Ala-tRNA(Pro) deacylase